MGHNRTRRIPRLQNRCDISPPLPIQLEDKNRTFNIYQSKTPKAQAASPSSKLAQISDRRIPNCWSPSTVIHTVTVMNVVLGFLGPDFILQQSVGQGSTLPRSQTVALEAAAPSPARCRGDPLQHLQPFGLRLGPSNLSSRLLGLWPHVDHPLAGQPVSDAAVVRFSWRRVLQKSGDAVTALNLLFINKLAFQRKHGCQMQQNGKLQAAAATAV